MNMGVTKTNLFTDQQNRLATIGKALAHPARIAILEFLLKEKDCVCRAIVDELPLSQSTISQHLKVLKECGMIIGTIEGKQVCYCINPQYWNTAKELLAKFLIKLKPSCC